MKFKIFTTIILGFLAMSSCDSDDKSPNTPSGQTSSAPQMIATIEQSPLTRAGVIEDNDYKLGENFYWATGDEAFVYFVPRSSGSIAQSPQVKYVAQVDAGVKSKSCTFTGAAAENGNLEDGEYSADGFFPASLWGDLLQYGSGPKFVNLTAAIPAIQTQSDASSTHLGKYMLMRARNNVTVSGSTPININYEQLTSILRFAVWNNTNRDELKLTNIDISLASEKSAFSTKGYASEKSASFAIIDANNCAVIGLELTGAAQNFVLKDGKQQCEGYMVALSTITTTNPFSKEDQLLIKLAFTDGSSNYTVNKSYDLNTQMDFLTEKGLEQGKSYYFQLKVEEPDFVLDVIPTIETVLINAGTFLMGSSNGTNIGNTNNTGLNTTDKEPNRWSNETQHKVTLTKDFRMSKYAITNAQYAEFLNKNRVTYEIGISNNWSNGNGGKCSWGNNSGQIMILTHDWGVTYGKTSWAAQSGYENHPVINVTWYGASEYANWIGGSLPTEAQWEYACRAGTTTPFSLGTAGDGNSFTYLDGNFNCTKPYDLSAVPPGEHEDATAGAHNIKKTSPVGSYAPNAWGLYDMHGNVWELCSDWFSNSYDISADTDPTGPATGFARALRGGPWSFPAQYCRSASRMDLDPVSTANNTGFRVIMAP